MLEGLDWPAFEARLRLSGEDVDAARAAQLAEAIEAGALGAAAARRARKAD